MRVVAVQPESTYLWREGEIDARARYERAVLRAAARAIRLRGERTRRLPSSSWWRRAWRRRPPT